MPQRRALITGIGGFTGPYVAAELESAGFEVYGAGERPSLADRYTCVDLRDRSTLFDLIEKVQPHVVVHLAGLAFVGLDNAEAFYLVNTIGTRHLLEAVATRAPSIECVLLASSANVYGNSTEGILREETPPHPANDYGVSKLAMEYVARLFFDRLPIMIARPFNYTGIGQSETFLLPKIVGHFRRGERAIELGNIDVYRDFSDVRAVANAYRRLIEAKCSGEIVNVCSGQSHSLRELIAMAGEIAGYEIEIKTQPSLIRKSEVRELVGSADRLRQLVGEWHTPPLRDTLTWMYQA